jgi:hypothetical protein
MSTRLFPSASMLASTTTMSSLLIPRFCSSLKKHYLMLLRVSPLLTSMLDIDMIGSLLSSRMPRKVGALAPSSVTSNSLIPWPVMLFLIYCDCESEPRAVTNTVSVPSLLATSEMLRPTPPKDVLQLPRQLWYN